MAVDQARGSHFIGEIILSKERGGPLPIGDMSCTDVSSGGGWLLLIKRNPLVSDRAGRDLGGDVDSAASAVPSRHADAVGADLA